MSRNQRLGLVALVIVVAAVAFVIAKPGDEGDQQQEKSTSSSSTTTQPSGGETATKPEQPSVERVVIMKGKPLGGTRQIRVSSGDDVRIEVSADSRQELHLHGYGIERQATPGRPAVFRFRATAEGQFELESHTLEHAGLDPLLARLLVEPS